MQERQDAIDDIMRDTAGNFNTIKNKLRKADQRLVEVLSLVADEQGLAEDAMVKEKSAAERKREGVTLNLPVQRGCSTSLCCMLAAQSSECREVKGVMKPI